MTERILIVDDHPLTRDALAGLLAAERLRRRRPGGGAGRRRSRRPASSSPTSSCSTCRCPRWTGSTALPRVRQAAPAAEVVVLTASEDEHNLLGAIRSGAAGYLLKSEPPERIVAFLRGVAQGEAALSGPSRAGCSTRCARAAGGDGRAGVDRAGLSARELEVLLLLDRHLGTDEIATRLFISEHTVRSHVKSLLAKLGVSSRREALERSQRARDARSREGSTAAG